MKPGGVRWLAALGACHDDRITVFVIQERRCPLCSGPRTGVVNQGYSGLRPPRKTAAHLSTSSPIDSHMDFRRTAPSVQAALVDELRTGECKSSEQGH